MLTSFSKVLFAAGHGTDPTLDGRVVNLLEAYATLCESLNVLLIYVGKRLYSLSGRMHSFCRPFP